MQIIFQSLPLITYDRCTANCSYSKDVNGSLESLDNCAYIKYIRLQIQCMKRSPLSLTNKVLAMQFVHLLYGNDFTLVSLVDIICFYVRWILSIGFDLTQSVIGHF